ncbi:MAG: hypothetical protein KF888_09070 [Nitrosomonas sp.]|nr:hypothetical protein [Nitrosomonas sp.]
MEAAEILEYLREKNIEVKLVDDNYIDLLPAGKITDELIQRLRQHKPAIIAELKREERRQKVLQMLEDNPGSKRAFITDTDSDRDNVIVAVAIRGTATCEIEIPKNKYDPFLFLELINKVVVQ